MFRGQEKTGIIFTRAENRYSVNKGHENAVKT